MYNKGKCYLLYGRHYIYAINIKKAELRCNLEFSLFSCFKLLLCATCYQRYSLAVWLSLRCYWRNICIPISLTPGKISRFIS